MRHYWLCESCTHVFTPGVRRKMRSHRQAAMAGNREGNSREGIRSLGARANAAIRRYSILGIPTVVVIVSASNLTNWLTAFLSDPSFWILFGARERPRFVLRTSAKSAF